MDYHNTLIIKFCFLNRFFIIVCVNIFLFFQENRVSCCKSYTDCFNGKISTALERTTTEPSLFTLVNSWLESTPNLKDGNVWDHYRKAADRWLEESLEVYTIIKY